MTMTPKEKAENLVDEYYQLLGEHILNGHFDVAKDCALIAVQEVRNFHYKLFFASKGSLLDQYLDKVKIEIEKL